MPARAPPSTEDPTARFPSVRLLRPLFAGAMAAGVDPLEVFREAGVSAMAVADGNVRVPPQAVERAYALAAARAGADFGVRTIESVDWAAFGDVGALSEHLFVAVVLTRKTVGEALAAAERYSWIAFGDGGYRLRPVSGGVQVHCTLVRGVAPDPVVADYVVSLAYVPVSQRATRPLPSARFHFAHAPPPSRAAYERRLGKALFFGARWNGFFLSEEDLAVPLKGYQPQVAAELEARAEQAVAQLTAFRSFSDSARTGLVAQLERGAADADALADALGVSRRSLTRKLQAEGTSYQALLDAERARLADRYLREEGLSVTDTAQRLGFSDPSTFHRAFRRWFGKAPAAHRREAAPEAPPAEAPPAEAPPAEAPPGEAPDGGPAAAPKRTPRHKR
jgi:AraC-like DNA-binding protein